LRPRGSGWKTRGNERSYAQFAPKNTSEVRFMLIRELLKKDLQLRRMLLNYVLSSELFKYVSKPKGGTG